MRFNMRSFGLGVAMVVPILAGLAVDRVPAGPGQTYCQNPTPYSCSNTTCTTVQQAYCPNSTTISYTRTMTTVYMYSPCGEKVTPTVCPLIQNTINVCTQFGYLPGSMSPCQYNQCSLSMQYSPSC